MHYSTNFICVCGRCMLIHAPAPGITRKCLNELQKHLVKAEPLGELSRRVFLEVDISRSAACFASCTFQLTTAISLPFFLHFSNDKCRFGSKHTTCVILWPSVTLPLKYCNLVLFLLLTGATSMTTPPLTTN